ncbi:MAG: hypothetical protein BWY91_02467 [bacterium ADurb.BinA028]|nr:MAG: hypothetical protein BWY91_02467 [bacterium ADurb.BinA028]
MLGDRAGSPLRVLQGGGADVDPTAAGREGNGQRIGVADPAGEFHLKVQPADDVSDQFAVVPTAEGRVEIDQVDPLGAVVLPTLRGQPGVAELPPRAGDALLQLHGTSVGDVDGGQQLQSGRLGHDGFSSGLGVGRSCGVGGAAASSGMPSAPGAISARCRQSM